MNPNHATEYAAAIADGHTLATAPDEAWRRAYAITTDSGEYRSREQVIRTVGAELRKCRVATPSAVARRYVDDHDWMRRHTGEAAGSIARTVAEDAWIAGLWFTHPVT
jgi:hypothetical protein